MSINNCVFISFPAPGQFRLCGLLYVLCGLLYELLEILRYSEWYLWSTTVSERSSERAHHHTTSLDALVRKNHILHVKLSGDGTNIGKRLHVINLTFTLLEGALAYSAEGNHLEIIKESEKYDTLCDALQDFRSERTFHNGSMYTIMYYLGGDWKFLAICTGIDSATSTYACIWCKCSKQDLPNVEKGWSITDTTHGARTIEENMRFSRKHSFNVSHTPLFPGIPLANVIDNLHMFLRMSDVLLTQLLDRLGCH